ncbi:sugar MFS transporter [Pontibacter sp. 13R65]
MLPLKNQLEVTQEATHKRKYGSALCTLAVLYFMMGFITVLNDTLVPFFKQGFTLTYSKSSLVQFYFFLTYGLLSIPSGKVVEKIGYKNGMVAGFLVAGLGAFLFLPASWYHQYELFLVALFVVATGIVLLQVAANPYITALGSPETAASRLSLIQGVGSIGTTVAPVFGAHFILSRLQESNESSDALVKPYLVISLTLLLIGIVVFRMALPKINATTSSEEKIAEKPPSIFSYRNLNYGIIALFMYVGAEVAIGSFLTNYIADTLLIEEHAANLYLSVYWGGMLIGRFVGAYVLKLLQPSKVLAVVAAISASLVLTSIMSTGYLAVWTLVLVGLCNSIMFAVIFSLAVNGLGRSTSKASGLLSTAIVGGAVLTYAQGILIDHFSWEVAFIVPLCCYIYIIFYGLSGYKPYDNVKTRQ